MAEPPERSTEEPRQFGQIRLNKGCTPLLISGSKPFSEISIAGHEYLVAAMRFYIKLFAVLSLAVLCWSASGYCQNLSRIRAIASRPTSDHRATEEMHAIETKVGWDILVAAPPPTTAPTTQP